MDKKDYEINQRKLIKALVEKIREVRLLETKLTLYELFLTDSEIEAADSFAKVLCEGSVCDDAT